MEGIYKHIEEVEPERIRELMRAHKEEAYLCKKLATIIKEDGIALDLNACKVHNLDVEKVRTVFGELGFRGHLGRVEKLNKDWEKLRVSEKQESLF